MKNRVIAALILLIIFLISASGQNEGKKSDKPITITGKVYSPDDQPVAGAVIYIDNIKTSYITSEKGTFKIKVNPSAYKLKVSSSRFGIIDTLINGQTNINFHFADREGAVKSQGQVNGGNETGESRSKAKKMNTYTNIYQMIQNEVPGVLVSGKKLVIQQPNSFYGSSDPLLVVDAVIVSTIDQINPLDVKSISVLTGSAAAFYGVQGANGVISIVLKNGTETDK